MQKINFISHVSSLIRSRSIFHNYFIQWIKYAADGGRDDGVL